MGKNLIFNHIQMDHIQLYFFSDRVSPHMRLRGGVEFIDRIPKSSSGKILRRVLRDRRPAS